MEYEYLIWSIPVMFTNMEILLAVLSCIQMEEPLNILIDLINDKDLQYN